MWVLGVLNGVMASVIKMESDGGGVSPPDDDMTCTLYVQCSKIETNA